jgi:hypothetical protein
MLRMIITIAGTSVAMFLGAPAGAADAGGGRADGPGPRHLLVQVRDTPPPASPSVRRARDRSYTVSTGDGGASDEPADAVHNGTTLSTGAAVRQLTLLEGEPVRIDLPAVQSLQFHLPTTGAAPPASAKGAGPSASGVVFFEAVTAFRARFALVGSQVRIELAPLRTGTVLAPPLGVGAEDPPRPLFVAGRIGQWIALGDTELAGSMRSLSVTADPPTPASLWVRVLPGVATDGAEPAEAGSPPSPADNSYTVHAGSGP